MSEKLCELRSYICYSVCGSKNWTQSRISLMKQTTRLRDWLTRSLVVIEHIEVWSIRRRPRDWTMWVRAFRMFACKRTAQFRTARWWWMFVCRLHWEPAISTLIRMMALAGSCSIGASCDWKLKIIVRVVVRLWVLWWATWKYKLIARKLNNLWWFGRRTSQLTRQQCI